MTALDHLRGQEWSDADMLMALRMEDEGASATEIGKRLGRARNGVLGIRKRVRDAYVASCAGDPDPDRHDGTMGWTWVESGLRKQGKCLTQRGKAANG